MKRKYISIALGGVSFVALAIPAFAETAADPDGLRTPIAGAIGPEEIIVTARRREESLQRVPISVQAFSGEALAEKQVRDLRDLTFTTPGVVFTANGTSYQVAFTIRGQSKPPVGTGIASVITYVNDVPMQDQGSAVPTFDLENVQVLKGPQGTLFGRSTIGGAVLVNTRKPSYDLEGYGSAIVGSYDWLEGEGAFNVPIVDQKLAFRGAFNIVTRDGYTKNLSSPHQQQDNKNNVSLRGSLLFEPFDGFKNTTVVDYYDEDEGGPSSYIHAAVPGGFARFYPNLFDCGTSPSCDVDLAFLRQQQEGRTVHANIQQISRVKIWGVSNSTAFDLGNVTVKNIFGMRRIKIQGATETDGFESSLVSAYGLFDNRQITDEIQVSGSLIDGRLNWLVGGFYLTTRPEGAEGGAVAVLLPDPSFIENISFAHAYYRNREKALFGQISFSPVSKLTINAGYRYTWSEQDLCTTSNRFANARILEAECRQTASSFRESTKSSAPNWTVGVDYQATDDVFLYVSARQGSRSGGLNAPRLSALLSQYQTFGRDRVRDIEVGAKTRWRVADVSGAFNIAAYRGIHSNIQRPISSIFADGDSDPSNNPASSTLLVNAGKARIQGIELDGSINATSRLRLTFGGAYTDAKFTDFSVPQIFNTLGASGGSPVFQQTPDFTTNVGARYEMPVGAGSTIALAVDLYHTSPIYRADIKAPSYELINSRVEWRNFLSEGLDVSLFVRNLANKKYISAVNLGSTVLTLQTVQLGQPRMVGMQMKYRFGLR